LKSKLIKETIWSFSSKAVTFVLFYALNIYLARVLGVELFGQWSFFYSILSIILLVSYFGINASSKKFVAEYNNTKDLGSVLKGAFQARFIFSLIFSIVVACFSKQLANFIGKPELSSLLLLSTPLVFLSGGVEFLKDIFAGLHRVKYNFIINFFEFGLKLFFVWLFFLFGIQISSIIGAYSVGLFFALVVGLYFVYLNFYKRNKRVDKNYLGEILRYSLPLFFVSLGFWIATEIDTVMLGYLRTDAEVGIFSAAKQIIIKLPHIAVAISMGTMPLFAKMSDDNKDELRKLFYKLLRYNSVIFGLIMLIILFLSWWFMPLIYGQEYAQSYVPLILLAPYLVMFSYSIFLSTLLDYKGLAKKRAFNLSITVILNIILNYLLIPKFGINGAAVATSVSYTPYFVLNWLEVKGVFKTKTYDEKD
jgi:O-antigen/teichoic acid export membrane protein